MTLDATVSPGTTAVTFTDAGTLLGTAAVNSLGHATLVTSSLTVGTHPITASFAGGSVGPTNATVIKANTTTTVVSAIDTTTDRRSITISAVAAVAPATGVPTGTVLVINWRHHIVESGLLQNGTVTINTSRLRRSTHPLIVVYAGSSGFNSSIVSHGIIVTRRAIIVK